MSVQMKGTSIHRCCLLQSAEEKEKDGERDEGLTRLRGVLEVRGQEPKR